MTVITSASNTQIKRIRALRRRRPRDRAGVFWVEGTRLVSEAVEMKAAIETLVVAEELLGVHGPEIVARARERDFPILEVTGSVFRTLSARDGPTGIGAVVLEHWDDLSALSGEKSELWVALDSVQDPGNLGSIIRTVDAVDAAGVILLAESTDPYDPAAVRASMGSIFSRRMVRASLDSLLESVHAQGFMVVGASGESPVGYRSATYTPPLILLMGSEREGLSETQRRACDVVASIPMSGRADSLNLSVATAIILYEIVHQRGSPVIDDLDSAVVVLGDIRTDGNE